MLTKKFSISFAKLLNEVESYAWEYEPSPYQILDVIDRKVAKLLKEACPSFSEEEYLKLRGFVEVQRNPSTSRPTGPDDGGGPVSSILG
jgi:hypothetical protein